MKLIQAALICVAGAGLALGACDSKSKTDTQPVAVEGAKTAESAAKPIAKEVAAKVVVAKTNIEVAAKANPGAEKVVAGVAPVAAVAHEVTANDAPSCKGGESDCPFHDEKVAHGGHDHAGKADPTEGGCGAHAADDTIATSVTPEGTHFGAPFALTANTPLGTTLGKASADTESTVRVAGQIHKVCAKKGCWLIVKDGDAEARVIMKGYAFTVPTDSTGKKAVVEGALKVKVFTEAQAKHLAEDGGEDPATVTGEKREYLLTATSIQIGAEG
jgi:hypothetical protein